MTVSRQKATASVGRAARGARKEVTRRRWWPFPSVAMLWLVLACGSTPATTPAPPPGPRTFQDLTAQLRQTFEDSARRNGIIGAQVAVSVPGQPLWTAEFGFDTPGTPMTSDLLLGTGSISKMFAAVAALRQVDRGTLALTDTIGRWFPNVPNVSPQLTLRHLLWHQSGLTEYGAAATYSAEILADLNRSWTADELLRFVGPPTFAPGTAWSASNTDRLLLGTLVSRITGMPYGEYLRVEMLTQDDAGSWTPGQLVPAAQRIGTHWVLDNAGQPVNYSAQLFGPSLFTSRVETYISARALALFAWRMFDGDLLSPAARTLLLTIVPDDGRIAGQTGGGVGIRRFEFGGRLLYGNSGGTANSAAMYLYDPATKVIAAVSTNQGGPGHNNAHFPLTTELVRLASDFVAGR